MCDRHRDGRPTFMDADRLVDAPLDDEIVECGGCSAGSMLDPASECFDLMQTLGER